MTEVADKQPIERPAGETGLGREILVVACLVLIAAAVRTYIAYATYCISKDSVRFLDLAQCLREREFGSFFENVQHHLYPFLLFAAQDVVGTGVAAALALNVAAGSLAVIPFYLLARNVFGRKAAAAAGLFFAFHAVLAQTAATVATEPLYLLAFLWALYAGKRAIDAGGAFLFTITGFLIGLTFLVRPEGLGLWVLIGGWTLLMGLLKTLGALILRREYAPSGARLLGGCVLMAAATGVTVFPHLLETRLLAGQWGLTRKHEMGQIVRGEPIYSPSQKGQPEIGTRQEQIRYALTYLNEIADESLWGYHLVSALPLFYLLGVLCRRSQPRELLGELILASASAAYLAAVVQFLRVHHYVTERHLISSAVIVLMWAGAGFRAASDRIARLLARYDKLERAPARITAVLLMLVTLGTMSLKTLQPIREEKAQIPELGERIRRQFPPPKGRATRIASFGLPRVVFYAGGRQIRADRYIYRLIEGSERVYESFMKGAAADRPDLLLLQLGAKAGAGDAARDIEIHEALERRNIAPDQVLEYEDDDGAWRLLLYRFDKLPPPSAKRDGKEGE
ncbi:MAG: glycosyltransferase family 39 protein [Planctomycetota bacterium]